MNIKAIIAGADGLFSDSLIARLKQEGCETFVITGDKSSEDHSNSGILETYHYEYDNYNVPFIIESTKVDVLIFTGALDDRFSWNTQSDAIAYIGGLYNMLISASRSGVKRFIYLSTTDVYEQLDEGFIDETSSTRANGLRLMTILNGEEIVLRYRQESDMEVVVLRCSEVYGSFNNKVNRHSFCTTVCNNLLNGNKITINQNQKHDNVHISDLIELVYNIMKRDKPIPHSVYNICSGNSLTEKMILWMITEITGRTEEALQNEDSILRKYEYSHELAKKELMFHQKYTFEEGLIEFVRQQMETVKEKANQKDRNLLGALRKNLKDIFGWFFPYLETFATFAAVQVIVNLFGNFVFFTVIDLYLLFVVFIAIIYGKGHTIAALLLSLGGKLFSSGEYSSLIDIAIDYKIYLWLLQLLVIGMGIGFIRDNYKQIIGDNEEENKYLRAELAEIKDINYSNIRIKQIYESRLVNYKDSFAKIYSIVSKLDDLEPDKIMFAAVDVVSKIMRSNEVAIYSVNKGGDYARLTASSVNIRSNFNGRKSIQLDTMEEVIDSIRNKRIYVNRSLDQDKPSMAGGVYHDEKLESIIIIRSLPFEYTTLYHMNLFAVVLNLIAQALHRANYFINENQSNRYIENTSILTQQAFYNIVEIRKSGHDEQLADYYILELITNDLSLKQMNDIIVPTLRQNDYLGLGYENKLYLLLANTTESEAEFVKTRLASKGIDTRKGVVEIHGA